MKNTMHIAAALLVAFASGCTEVNGIDEPEGHEITITASFAENRTKTTLQDGGTQVFWESGDEIKVFYETNGSRFTSTLTESAATSDFSGSLNFVIGGNEEAGGNKNLWAVYPYRSDATSDGSSITTTLPSEQTGRAGSFAKSTNISLAKSSTFNLGFYNVCGGVRFSVTRSDVRNVVFEALGGESVAGKIKLGFTYNVPVVNEVIEGEDVITLSAPGGGVFEAGKWYYIVTLPVTLSGGFKMTFNTETRYAVLKSTDARTVKRGKFGSLADADEDLVYKDKGMPEPGEGNIVFKDIVAKVACVEKFDTDGDGELSYDEAKAVTSIAGLFTDYNTVTRFDELRHFTGITNLGSALNGLTRLKSVTIPEGVTSIEDYAFLDCSALDSISFAGNAVNTIGNDAFENCIALAEITLPSAVGSIGQSVFNGCTALTEIKLSSSLTTIGQYAFNGCSALKSVEIPSGVKAIPDNCFQNCSALKTVGLPSAIKSIGSYSFDGCRMLEAVEFPSGLTSVGSSAFRNCEKINTVSLPNAVTSLGSAAFSGCTFLESATLPSGLTSLLSELFRDCTRLYSVTFPTALTSIGDYTFYNCAFCNPSTNVSRIDIPETVTSIGNNAFSSVRNVLVHSNAMVSIGTSAFSTLARLFVPDSKVENYKIRTNWSNYATHIFALSSYTDTPVFESVDLGMSVKWATCNVGAALPEEYGNYYAWGETETKDNYYWPTYKYCNGTDTSITKYCTNSEYGTVDNKTVLEPDDDVAQVKWGGSWRMPTDAEWTELRENCTWTWTTRYGVCGILVASNKEGYTDKSIFLPAAGWRNNITLNNEGLDGFYRSSSLDTTSSGGAWSVFFDSDNVSRNNYNRSIGMSVRPVCE